MQCCCAGLAMKEIIEKMLVSPTLLRVLRVFRIGRILRLVKSATAAMRPLATSSVAEARPGLSVAASASRQVGQGHPDAAVLAGRVPAGAVQHRSRACANKSRILKLTRQRAPPKSVVHISRWPSHSRRRSTSVSGEKRSYTRSDSHGGNGIYSD